MPFAASLDRVILSQRVSGEFVGAQDAAQVRVTDERDTEHVEDFALHPIRTAPQAIDRRQRRLRIIHESLHDEPLAGLHIQQAVDDAKAIRRVGIFEIIHGGQINQIIKAELVLQVFAGGA